MNVKRWLCLMLLLSMILVGVSAGDMPIIKSRVLETSAQPGSIYSVYLYEGPLDLSNGWTQSIKVLSHPENWPDGWTASLWVCYSYEGEGWHYGTTSQGENAVERYNPGHDPETASFYVRFSGHGSDSDMSYRSRIRVIVRALDGRVLAES